ncbi:MAG TPA: amidase [Solirubrobacteraceae bacterium]|nr:amidase [Solirubrobacteraceae bacterium]
MPSTASTASSQPERTGELSAAGWLARLDDGSVSACEIARHYLDRIAAVDPALHAVVACDPAAVIDAAGEADAARARGERGPLLGLPVTIKDSIDVAGLPCTGGSIARAGHRPARDATVVARLRGAGAIILAKTNVPEYSSSYETDNVVHGRTNHPLDPARTPGGSSGGEAALVAADATPLGIGTDGGGSLRVPAHYCGIVGLRPTVGRVPDTGIWPATRAGGYMDLFCVGPIARRVEDVALTMPVIAGPDWIDPYAVPAPLGDHHTIAIDGLRVGWFAGDPRLAISNATLAALAAAAGALADAGATVTEVSAPWEEDPTALFFDCVAADGGAQLRADLGAADRHVPQFQALIDAVERVERTAADWFSVQRRVFEVRRRVRELAASVDVLLCPVVAGPAPRHGEAPGPPTAGAEPYRAFDYVHLLALGGLPAASVPAGSEVGLPVGVQVAAPPFREDLVLAAAAIIESRLPSILS